MTAEELKQRVAELEAIVAEQNNLIEELQIKEAAAKSGEFAEIYEEGKVTYLLKTQYVQDNGNRVLFADYLKANEGMAAKLVERKSEIIAVQKGGKK